MKYSFAALTLRSFRFVCRSHAGVGPGTSQAPKGTPTRKSSSQPSLHQMPVFRSGAQSEVLHAMVEIRCFHACAVNLWQATKHSHLAAFVRGRLLIQGHLRVDVTPCRTTIQGKIEVGFVCSCAPMRAAGHASWTQKVGNMACMLPLLVPRTLAESEHTQLKSDGAFGVGTVTSAC